MDIDHAHEDRYAIVNPREILALLNELKNTRHTVSVEFGPQRESLLTTLLRADAGGLIFDLGGDAHCSARLFASPRLRFSCRPDGVLVRFDCEASRRVLSGDGEACLVPVPRRLLRLQRREYFRVTLPVARPVPIRVQLPGGSVSLQLHDLSVAGAGLDLRGDLPPLTLGERWSSIPLHIGREGLHRLNFVLRHVTSLTHGTTKPSTRVGVSFDGLSAADDTALQRWITLLEREKRKFEHMS